VIKRGEFTYLMLKESKGGDIVLGTAALQNLSMTLDYNETRIIFEGLSLFDIHRTTNIIVLSIGSAIVALIIVLLVKKCTTKEED